MVKRKAILVGWRIGTERGVEELNKLLEVGWTVDAVHQMTACPGAVDAAAAIFVLAEPRTSGGS